MDAERAIEVLADIAIRYMRRTGCGYGEARDAAAGWLYVNHPNIAAAITITLERK